MIGDILDDVEAGRRAGCRAILIDNGHETEWQLSPLREPQQRARNFLEAAEYIGQYQEHLNLEALPV
jgi:phosphoglycolate phosphatase-like HAD superfamily hydrolase